MNYPIYTVLQIGKIYRIERYNQQKNERKILPDYFTSEDEVNEVVHQLNKDAYDGVPKNKIPKINIKAVDSKFGFYILDDNAKIIEYSFPSAFITQGEAKDKGSFLRVFKDCLDFPLSDGKYIVYVVRIINGHGYSTVKDLIDEQIYVTSQHIDVKDGSIRLI